MRERSAQETISRILEFELTLVVPPAPGGAGEVDPAVLVVCRKLGLRRVFRVNGPAGIAACVGLMDQHTEIAGLHDRMSATAG